MACAGHETGSCRSGQPPINLYFDDESGLLVRLVRFAETPIGRVPTQIGYADYREVSGVLMPFRWTETWTTGQSMIQLTEVRANVPIDPARFERLESPRRSPFRR